MNVIAKFKTLHQRFWDEVGPGENGSWVWTGGKKKGYGWEILRAREI